MSRTWHHHRRRRADRWPTAAEDARRPPPHRVRPSAIDPSVVERALAGFSLADRARSRRTG
jgi:hypothetical protein